MTLLLLLGIPIGEHALALIPQGLTERFELIANIALLVIGFLLGGRLTVSPLRAMAGPVWSAWSICRRGASAS